MTDSTINLSRQQAMDEILSRCAGDYASIDGCDYIRDPATDEWRPYRDSDGYNVLVRMQSAIDNYRQSERDHAGIWVKPYEIPIALAELLRQHITATNVIDTYKTYCESCAGKWDGVDRISTLADCIGLYADLEQGPAYARAVAYALVLGPVERRTRPFDQTIVPIIISPNQGVGKSTTLRALATAPEHYNSVQGSLDRDNGRAFALRAEWASITEFGEIDYLFRKNDNSFLKQLLTESKISIDEKYARHPRDLYFRSFFCGTSNARQFLTDTSGNRRYAPVYMRRIQDTPNRSITDVTSPLYLPDHPEYVEQLIGQAYTMVQKGAHWNDLMDADFREMQSAMCSEAMVERAGLDVILQCAREIADRMPWMTFKQKVLTRAQGYNPRMIEETLADFRAHCDLYGVSIRNLKISGVQTWSITVTDADKLFSYAI